MIVAIEFHDGRRVFTGLAATRAVVLQRRPRLRGKSCAAEETNALALQAPEGKVVPIVA